MKKIVACILALVLLAGAIIFNLPSGGIAGIATPTRVLAAPVPREGYLLEPTLQGITGVDTGSAFLLTSPATNAEMPDISIDGQPIPVVERTGSNTFLITPDAPLNANSLYLFRLARPGFSDVTWAFQTTVRFGIVSTLPGNQATNVPVDTGIEFTFTTAGHNSIEDYFTIYPSVDGRFITRGATTVFMPRSRLSHQQIYTVTLRAGIGLDGTNEVITEDHVFSFETEATSGTEPSWQRREAFRFLNRYAELPSFEPPSISFSRNIRNMQDHDTAPPPVTITVYRFDSREDGKGAFRQLMNAPWWAHFAWQNSLIDTRVLTQVLSFEVTETVGDDWFEVASLPETLPQGFYLINAATVDIVDQMILQITDLAVHIIADDDRALVWVNDMTTGQPAAGAQITDHIGQSTYTVNQNGTAFIERQLDFDEDITITATDGKEISLFAMGGSNRGWWGGPQVDEDYWTVLQLDRTLFQRDDDLYFWGFVQGRDGRGSSNIRNLTATVTQSWGWGWDASSRDVLHRQTVTVTGGVYSGRVSLPNLDPGSYNLVIAYSDTVLGTIFFRVDDFVKPPYQMLLTPSQRAVFAGEEVTFTIRTEFFDGTPVPELGINYDTWGWQLGTLPSGRGTTDADGEYTVSITPIAGADIQGRTSLELSASATLPEIGPTHRWSMVDVFVNDISVNARATREGADASLSINVNNITLDRLNDGTSTRWDDYLCDPVSGQNLDVVIYRVYWVPQRDGERYCFIERRVIPRYRHDRREEVLQRFSLTTNENGEASQDFTLPNRPNESYHARVTTRDGNGRQISHSLFIGRDWGPFMWRADENHVYLYNPNDLDENFDIGDEVVLTVKRGLEPLTTGSFLFMAMQSGIIQYQVGDTNPFAFTFSEEHVPNVTVYAIHFNGHTYHHGWDMTQHLRFNRESRGLDIQITANQASYRPGETPSLTITVTDQDGNPRAADINISVVDEALFALQNYHVDTLSDLYRNVSDRLRFNMSTHRNFVSAGIDDIYGTGNRTWGMYQSYSMDFAGDMAEMDDAAAEPQAAGAAPGGDTQIREIFRDTAIFESRRANAQGEAAFSFQLPDNITSWRVTVSAITNDLYAGTVTQNIIVTNPMFVHYTLGSTFLVGDVPTIGVNAYGTGLTGGETLTFEVWCEDNPQNIATATGRPFERINIPLWEMSSPGTNGLIIRGQVDGNQGLSDAVRHEYRIIETHRQVDTAVFYEVTRSTTFSVGQQGMTSITFTDHGRGQFFHDLLGMRNIRGAHSEGLRLEGLVAGREADRLIAAHFPDAELWDGDTRAFTPSDYQRPDGGLAILPHADSCLETTVRLMPFLLDQLNIGALRNYLYYIFEGNNADNKMLALYGLALLGEPVLLYLQDYARVENLPTRDIAFIALGFAALGETAVAENMYRERIVPSLQEVEPLVRAYANLGNHSILETTSAVALLAAKINMPENLALHQYASRHRTCDLLVVIERLSFITHEITRHSAISASITYTMFGETVTRDLSQGRSFTLRIPTQNMHEFNLTAVTGQVGAVSIQCVPLTEIDIIDNDITVSRRFLREGGREVTGNFRQDEVIRVEISIDYSRKAIQGSYQVTDFLPAGIAFIPGSARFRSPRTGDSHWTHAIADGQRVSFFDFNSKFDGVRVYYYYARVINPGTFTAEGVLVQYLGARGYMTVGDDSRITVEG